MRKFMRTRGTGPQPPPLARDTLKTNGHANGATLRRDDQHSTLSRYWSGSERSGWGGRRALWEDAEFPAAAAALAPRRSPRDLLWLRPHELCSRPRFMGDSIVEGEGGSGGEGAEGAGEGAEEDEELAVARWRAAGGAARLPALGAAAAALALTPRLLARVVPPHSFRRRYTGAFRFHFWVFGVWREVCVDDRLPARRSPRGPQLLCARSTASDDFTLPLLEKAYAKLYGSYAAARAAGVACALQELSGGVVQSFAPPRQPRALLLQVLHAAVPRCTLLVATVADLPLEKRDKKSGARRLRNGLVTEQAYLVTGLARVRAAEGAEGGGALVRLRAASGVGEWAAAWARGSPEWRALAPPDRDLLAQRAAAPGHFWMSFGDFARAFARLELVHVGPDDWLGEPALHGKRPWRAVLARRRWRAGYNAGGPPAARTAHANPQFQLVVPRAADGEGAAHAVVSVTQQYAPGRARRLHGIGFALYELPPGAPPRRAPLVSDLHELKPLDVTHECRAREVATFFTLPPGAYLLVPHTRRAHREAAFLLRVLTDRHTDVWEVNDDNVIVRDISTELVDEDRVMPERVAEAARRAAGRRGGALEADELDARALGAALRAAGGWAGGWAGGARAGRAVVRALLALRDPGAAGRMPARELPALLALLALWRDAWGRAARCGAVSAYELRALLWACGVRASNKVLECVVLRYARHRKLQAEPFVLALARLHLAHERYRTLDTKLKSNPLSLEEMILMTIYS